MTVRVYINDPIKGYDYICDICNKILDTRKEVFHHTLHEHYPLIYGWPCPHCPDKK